MGLGNSRSSDTTPSPPPTPHEITITNITNAHNQAINNITSKYNDIMAALDTTNYDKAFLVQNLSDSYNPRAEFANIATINGVDMAGICSQNKENLNAKKDEIDKANKKNYAENIAKNVALKQDIDTVINTINANKILISNLNSFKDNVISGYKDNIDRMMKESNNALELIKKINADSLAALVEDWDALFKISDDILNDYIDTLLILSNDIALTISINEASMKEMKIDYNTEIVDTHIKNYRKLFAALYDENNAFDIHKIGITDLYSSKGKQNEYDIDSVARVAVLGKWLFLMYIVTFIGLVIVLLRHNSIMTQSMKFTIISIAAVYPFFIQYVELYAYFLYIYLLEKTYYMYGDLRFEPK